MGRAVETNIISTIGDGMGARVPAPAALTDLPRAVADAVVLLDENVGPVRQVHPSKRTRCPAAGVSEAPLRYQAGFMTVPPPVGYTWLHGLKGGRMIHVGAVDAPVAQCGGSACRARCGAACAGGAGIEGQFGSIALSRVFSSALWRHRPPGYARELDPRDRHPG
jgi:hypothetical protein